MTLLSFDTHQAIQLLRKQGFTDVQAEALVEFEKSKDTSQLASKHDLEKAISSLKVWVLTILLGQMVAMTGLMFALFQFFLK